LGHILLVRKEEGAASEVQGYGFAPEVRQGTTARRPLGWALADPSPDRLQKHARNEGKVVRMMPELMQHQPESVKP